MSYLIGGRLVAGGGLDAGQITLRQLVPKSLTVELTLNRAERIDADMVLPLIDPNTRAIVDLPQQLIPGRDFIGVVENGRLLAAGPVWGDPFTFPHTSMLKAEGLWSYFAHRAVLPVLAPGQLPRDVTSRWQGLSLRTIAKRIVQQACSHPHADLPIDFEDDFPGDNEREYPGSDLMSVAQALTNLTEVEGGPDIAFRPYLTEDRMHVRWRMVTGDPQLRQAGENHYWDVSAPGPTATLPGLERDGRELTSRAFVRGSTVSQLVENPAAVDNLNGFDIRASSGTHTLVRGTNLSPVGPARLRTCANCNLTSNVSTWFAVRSVANRVEEGRAYTASAWIGHNVDGARSLRVVIAWRGSDGNIISESAGIPQSVSSPTGTAASPWVRLTATGSAPADAVTADIEARVDDGGVTGRYVRATGFMLHEGTEVAPFTFTDVQLQAVSEAPMLTDAGFPLLESWDSRQSVLRVSTLQTYADEGALRGSAHITSRPIVARRNATPALGDYQPGDYALIRRAKSWREPAGTSVERIIRVRFGATGDVTIDTAPERVVSGYPVPSSDRGWLNDQLRALSARVEETSRGGK